MTTINTIVLFFFQTGEDRCPWWSEAIVVENTTLQDLHKIEEQTYQTINQCQYDDLEYREIIEKIMENFPYEWHMFEGKTWVNNTYAIHI